MFLLACAWTCPAVKHQIVLLVDSSPTNCLTELNQQGPPPATGRAKVPEGGSWATLDNNIHAWLRSGLPSKRLQVLAATLQNVASSAGIAALLLCTLWSGTDMAHVVLQKILLAAAVQGIASCPLELCFSCDNDVVCQRFINWL
jgi:hypothetical protein